MNLFSFETDSASYDFCLQIAQIMQEKFKIPENEAVGRINRIWGGKSFLGAKDIRYHEEEVFWANDIYYGAESFWWKNPPDLRPLPYP